MMRIACVANMNNMMFILCRYLRDEGFDAELVTLNDEPAHFHPGADSYTTNFENYHTILPLSKSDLYTKESIKIVADKLGDFDYYIGTDIAPAILAIIGKKLDVFIPHGSDIYALPFLQKRPKKKNKIWWLREKVTLGTLQKIGIENCSVILFPDEYDIHFPFKHLLNTRAIYHNTSGPMVYIPQYENLLEKTLIKELPHYKDFNQIREKTDLMIFSHSRHNGFNLKGDLAIHQKGNDILIKGFAAFVNKQPTIRCTLVLFEYGMDVAASKSLINDLQIENQVEWMPLMQRKEIMLGLNMADISCGQFDNSWLTCGVVNETLASNIPLLHFRDDQLYTTDYETLYPLLNAKTENDIIHQLENFLANKNYYKTNAKLGSEWLNFHTVQQPLEIIKNQLEQKSDIDLSVDVQKKVNNVLKLYVIKEIYYKLTAKVTSSFRR